MRKGNWVTHRRSTGRFGFGSITSLCGLVDHKLHATSNPRHVNCTKCLEIIAKLRAKAKERMAAL